MFNKFLFIIFSVIIYLFYNNQQLNNNLVDLNKKNHKLKKKLDVINKSKNQKEIQEDVNDRYVNNNINYEYLK